MRGIGQRAHIGGTFTWILDAEEGGQHEQFAQYIARSGFDQHATECDVDGQLRQGTTGVGQALVRIDRTEFGQTTIAVRDRAFGRRIDEREIGDLAEFQAQHAQDHAGQRRAQDFRLGVGCALRKILLVIQTKTNTRPDPTAATLALIRRGLRDRLDMQTFELIAMAIAFDACGTGVDDVADARHRQRSFGDVRCEHDAPLQTGLEHAILLGRGQARI